MKKLSVTVYATVFFGCFFGKAQVFRNNGVFNNVNPTTQPVNISQLEISGRLITQNAFAGTGAIPVAQQTGSFGATARWNSMGSLNAGTQILNGFRSQTDGRGLTMGYSVPSGGLVSNPTIQWIGNSTASALPGDLEFRVADNPGGVGAPANDRLVMLLTAQNKVQVGNPTNIPANPNYSPYPFRRAKIECYDGPNPQPYFNTATSATIPFFSTAALYAISQGTDDAGVSLSDSAGIVADVSNNNALNGTAAIVGLGRGGRNNWAGYFVGATFCTAGVWTSSDGRFKENVNAEVSSVALIRQLNPVTYTYKKSFQQSMAFSDRPQHGFIAQELEKVFPEMVEDGTAMTAKEGGSYKSVNYTMLIPVLTKAIQEQQDQIEALNKKIENMEAANKTIAAAEKGYSLSQNVPNH